MKRNREDKLRLINELLNSEGWMLLQTELLDLASKKEKELEGYLYDANTHKSFLHEGIKIGLELAVSLPYKMQKENRKFFERLYDKVVN